MTIEELQSELNACPELPVRPDPTEQELRIRRRVLDARIQTARAAAGMLAELDAELTTISKWREDLLAWRSLMTERLLTCTAKERHGLQVSITCIDHGFDFHHAAYPTDIPIFGLMSAAGYIARRDQPWNVWSGGHGPLPSVDERIANLQRRRDEAQKRLDSVLRDPVAP